MSAVDPTYPLLPVTNIISALLLSLVVLTSAVRKVWNFGVTSLCIWLFFENIGYAVNHIVWADNFVVRLYVYCDICEFTDPPSAITLLDCMLIMLA